MTTAIFPMAQWLTGTNQNSTSANDNALRMEACFGPALGFASSAPSTPANHDQYIVSSAWSGHAAGNIVIYLSGTWYEFTSYTGMAKAVAGVQYVRESSTWAAAPVWGTVPTIPSSPGKAGQIAFDSGAFYVCVAEAQWGTIPLSTW
jgi:hypothetical protein